MSSIFSTQNLQTFLRRKNLRPPPPSRGGPPGPRPPPPLPNRGRSPPERGPSLERGLSLGAACSGAFVSSAISLLQNLSARMSGASVTAVRSQESARKLTPDSRLLTTDFRFQAVAGVSAGAAGASATAAGAAGCA